MIDFTINPNSDIPKFRQIVDSVNNAISEDKLHEGDQLPSVNIICQKYKLSRDTVFKAYSMLKDQGIIESVPNKGYFIARELRKVFLFLDTFKAYKEVLYGEFVKHLPKNVIADVHFHHYKIDVFRALLTESKSRYTKYIIMPFDHPEMAALLEELPADKTLIIDWNIHASKEANKLYQDFGSAVTSALEEANHLLQHYQKQVLIYPKFTYHPYATLKHFEAFCQKQGYDYMILEDADSLEVKVGQMYFSVSDRILGNILEQCREKKLEPGKDVGILSYNETPMKKFIHKGISVISTDFIMMGQMAAEFASHDMHMDFCVPTKLFFRESL